MADVLGRFSVVVLLVDGQVSSLTRVVLLLALQTLLSILQLLDLLLEELSQELAELIKGDLTRFILVKDTENNSVALILIVLRLVLVVDSDQQRLDKGLDLFTLQGSRVISVDSVEDGLVDLSKLLFVRQNTVQIVDSFLVVHSISIISLFKLIINYNVQSVILIMDSVNITASSDPWVKS
jgi:hypothetical protein